MTYNVDRPVNSPAFLCISKDMADEITINLTTTGLVPETYSSIKVTDWDLYVDDMVRWINANYSGPDPDFHIPPQSNPDKYQNLSVEEDGTKVDISNPSGKRFRFNWFYNVFEHAHEVKNKYAGKVYFEVKDDPTDIRYKVTVSLYHEVIYGSNRPEAWSNILPKQQVGVPFSGVEMVPGVIEITKDSAGWTHGPYIGKVNIISGPGASGPIIITEKTEPVDLRRITLEGMYVPSVYPAALYTYRDDFDSPAHDTQGSWPPVGEDVDQAKKMFSMEDVVPVSYDLTFDMWKHNPSTNEWAYDYTTDIITFTGYVTGAGFDQQDFTDFFDT